jgi:hypothetical protein
LKQIAHADIPACETPVYAAISKKQETALSQMTHTERKARELSRPGRAFPALRQRFSRPQPTIAAGAWLSGQNQLL